MRCALVTGVQTSALPISDAATVDADAILVRVALFDRPFRGVDDVVLDAFGPLLVAGIPEGLAVAARAAVIHLEHEIAAAGKQLRFAVETTAVARTDRAAVRVGDHRQVAAIRAVRDGQVAMDAIAVSGSESEGVSGGH